MSGVLNFQIHWVTARWYRERNEWTPASASYRQALSCAVRIHEMLPHAEDRERYRGCQAGLLAEARECLLQVGLASEAEKLDGLFQAPAAPAERSGSRLSRRLGLGLSIFNFLVALVLIRVAAENFSGDTGQIFGLDGLLLLLASLLALFAALVSVFWIVQGLIPAWRSRGQWMLALALLPWIIWLVVVALFVTL